MEKIKLKDGTLFDIVPMGISQSDKVREIKFISTLPYAEVEALFDDVENIENIQHLSDANEELETFADCVAYKYLGKAKNVQINDSLTADVFTVELSIDVVEKTIRGIKKNVTYTEVALVEIYETILGGMA